MENYVAAQLADLSASALLGCLAAVVYDLLRTIRLRRRQNRTLTDVVDGIYVVALLLVLLWFCLRRGQGELRLFMVFGIIAGGGLYFLLGAPVLRPVWNFWADAAITFAALLWRPIAWLWDGIKKVRGWLKKYFHFMRKYAKIKRYKWGFILMHRKSGMQGGKYGKKKPKKTAHKPRDRAGGHRTGRHRERGGSEGF